MLYNCEVGGRAVSKNWRFDAQAIDKRIFAIDQQANFHLPNVKIR